MREVNPEQERHFRNGIPSNIKRKLMFLVLGTTMPGSKIYYTDLSSTASDEYPFCCSDCFIMQIQ
jgi:hypothetical protein